MSKRTFTAPGRIEICGNHTDHQHGVVLAAAVDMQVWCTATTNDTNMVNIKSPQYEHFNVDLRGLKPMESEKGTSAALVRGVAAWLSQHGHKIGGFDASVSSNIPMGAGMSSSAAFEVLIGNVFKGLYGAKLTPMDIAMAGKYAENEFFGKPCGMMDQIACSFGGLSMINFANPEIPIVTKLKANFSNYLLCVVDTGSSHTDMTPKYAAIPHEMMIVAGHFGKEFLQEVEPDKFYAQLGSLRKSGLSDRALLRAIHFFEENERVTKQAKALKSGNMLEFLKLVNESGNSSMSYLQNVFSASESYRQGLTLALALSEKILGRKGAWRVHGGGFGGTILAIIPVGLKSKYERQLSRVFGDRCCNFLSVSAAGGTEVNH